MNHYVISLIGNPNCGKTCLFNILTGSHQKVGNWPGVTTEKKVGDYFFAGKHYQVIDLPGTYAIESDKQGISEDEWIAREFTLNDQTSLLVNIVDASNLQRHLFLTFQLLEMRRPLIVVLNMMDVAQMKGIHIDILSLEKALGCPVIPTIATKKKGIKQLHSVIAQHLAQNKSLKTHIDTISKPVRTIIEQTLKQLPHNSTILQLNELLLFELLTKNSLEDTAYSLIEKEIIQRAQQQLSALTEGAGVDITLAGAHYEVIDQLANQVIKTSGISTSAFTEKLDHFTLGKWTGIPLFLLVIFLMFQIAISFGTAFNDFFDIFFGALFVDGSRFLLEQLHSPEWLITILSDGIGDGIKTTLSFMPVIFFMFLILSFLEDSGYLARAAMVIDRGMRMIGLPGRAFVPMIVGFGCNIPAIMGTRVLENAEDRLLSISMIPFISCSARLPVYALFVSIFFPQNGGIMVYALYLFGIAVAMFTGLLFKRALLSQHLSPFIMELPLYHLPTFKSLMLATWIRLKSFLKKAGKAILAVVTVLAIFNSVGINGSFGHNNSDQSLLAYSAKSVSAIFKPMGLAKENWPATVGIITGILAKEVVIGTLNSLYQQVGHDHQEVKKTFDLWASFKEALSTTKDNLQELPKHLSDPLGIGINLAGGNIKNVEERNEINEQAVNKIQVLFPNRAAVFAYLIFILLYTPCVAAIGAIYRESNLRWTILIVFWTLIVAWICSTAFYQIYLLHDVTKRTHALIFLIGEMTLLASIYFFLKQRDTRLLMHKRSI